MFTLLMPEWEIHFLHFYCCACEARGLPPKAQLEGLGPYSSAYSGANKGVGRCRCFTIPTQILYTRLRIQNSGLPITLFFF